MERKLAAILCADVCGYSRLMGADKEATLHALSSHRAIIDGLIECSIRSATAIPSSFGSWTV